MVDAAREDRLARHPEDHAGAFILGDIECPSLLHFQHPFGAIVPMPVMITPTAFLPQ